MADESAEKQLERWLGPGIGTVALVMSLVNTWQLATDDDRDEAVTASAIATGAGPGAPMGGPPGARPGPPSKAQKTTILPPGTPSAQEVAKRFAADEGMSAAQTDQLLAALTRRTDSMMRIRKNVKEGTLPTDQARAVQEKARADSDAEIKKLLGAERFARLEARLSQAGGTLPPPG